MRREPADRWHIMSCAPGKTPWILERGYASKEDAGMYYFLLTGTRPKTYKDKDPAMGDPELFWDQAHEKMGSEINSEAVARGE